MKLIAASLALSFGLLLASSQAFASCGCKTPPPPPPPCGCHQHHYHPVPVTPPPPPAPPLVQRFHGPCGSCNRDDAFRGQRCWQIPVTDHGQILYFRRECD